MLKTRRILRTLSFCRSESFNAGNAIDEIPLVLLFKITDYSNIEGWPIYLGRIANGVYGKRLKIETSEARLPPGK